MPTTDPHEHGEAPEQQSHRRLNVLTGDWVLVSPHRMKRPWQGQVEKLAEETRPPYDATCYLCPANERAGGERNPDYASTYAFDNDFAALQPDARSQHDAGSGLLRMEPEPGICRVICFSPRHDLTLPEMDLAQLRAIVELWTEEYRTLGARDYVNHVQIFENKGEVMGCSNPHPHGQIWGQRSVPVEPAREQERLSAYWAENGRSLLADYVVLEVERGERLVCGNDHFVALVPFWATWPFETLVVSRRHARSLLDFNDAERGALADILKRLTTRYDNLFDTSFPYSAGMHQAPTDGGAHAEWHWHMHFYPPLLRSATIRKFMVGYEMLGEPQRDITPEVSAARLRDAGEVHYRTRDYRPRDTPG